MAVAGRFRRAPITTLELPVEAISNEPAPRPPGRLPLPPAESPVDRRTYAALAIAIILAFAASSWVYWVPAHPGVDQNGYLVGGKMFARTLSTGFRPENPFAFVGRMWVQTTDGRCFPKYPLGLSILYAAMLKIGGTAHGVALCFGVNPVAMALALVATFLIVRRIAGSFAGVLGLLIVATSPVCVGLTNNPNSHATALCCVAWGMWFLLRWWESYGVGHAIGAGLLLGSAVTIRYTEGMLLLPIGVVAALNLRRDRRSWTQAIVLGLAWAVPVGAMAAYNLHAMRTLTGYDPTNESTGFAWANFVENWDTMLRELNTTGLCFTLPLALLGSVVMWRRDWRTSLLLTLWAVPNLLLYTAYYWAPDSTTSISYLRFTLTVFPALAAAAVLGAQWIATAAGTRPMATVAGGLVVAVGCATGLWGGLENSAIEATTNRAVLRGAQTVRSLCPAGSVVFGPDRTLNYLQFAGDYHLYDTTQFDRRFVQQMGTIDPNAPTGLQPQRAAAIYAAHKDDTDAELLADEIRLVTDAQSAGRRVFVLEPATGRSNVARLVSRGRFVSTVVGGWDETPEERLRAKRKTAGMNAKRAAALAANAAVTWQVIELKAPVPLALPSKRHRAR